MISTNPPRDAFGTPLLAPARSAASDRLPWPQAALAIASISAALWLLIFWIGHLIIG